MKSVLFSPQGFIYYQDTETSCILPEFDPKFSSGCGESFTYNINGIEYAAQETEVAPPGCMASGLRESHAILDQTEYIAAAKGAELIFWNKNTNYCCKCGDKLTRFSEISKICPTCRQEFFPHLSPAILVLVKKDDSALLVHAKNFKRPFYGLVAGFVETGESLEGCVEREVMEETSLKIRNIRYIGSQSWPFPSSLMSGFTAEYAGGTLKFTDGELTDGGFYSRENLPEIPTPPSLARELIDMWVNGLI